MINLIKKQSTDFKYNSSAKSDVLAQTAMESFLKKRLSFCWQKKATKEALFLAYKNKVFF